VTALSRQPAGQTTRDSRLRLGAIDLEHEDSIEAAFAAMPPTLRLVVVATGLLHGQGLQPEKSYRALDPEAMLRSYRINVVGPALVAKHVLPRLAPAGRSVFAALGARVGSIGDNRAGGWHSYRASKAALAMILRNLAIETQRRTPELLCVGLHPGTVATGLSQPFQRGVAPDRLFAPDFAAAHLLSLIDRLTPEQSGSVLAWDGQTVPP
jgi:NAD(P)-dependent dehydrogenase (short-subunit alcohol dehydrogenase family)